MRIIGGRFRRRTLEPPTWSGLRPSSDRLRETLFNVLGAEVDGARVLDLCAGTGAVGIEALSRGAAHVTFVESDPRACQLIARNLANCQVTEGYTIVQLPLTTACARLPGGFAIVFLDPSYEAAAVDGWVAEAATQVARGGVLIVEHARRRALVPDAGPLRQRRTLPSGDSALTFYRWPEPMSAGADKG